MSKRNGKMKYLAIGAAGLIAAGGLALDELTRFRSRNRQYSQPLECQRQ